MHRWAALTYPQICVLLGFRPLYFVNIYKYKNNNENDKNLIFVGGGGIMTYEGGILTSEGGIIRPGGGILISTSECSILGMGMGQRYTLEGRPNDSLRATITIFLRAT